MSERVCPWWLGYLLASPLRRLLENPHDLLAPYVYEGMTVLEAGPGMGFFTVELARLVGPSGKVIAVDLQQRMIAGLERRVRKVGLTDRVDARTVAADSLGLTDLTGKIDFVLAYAVLHEMPSSSHFFAEASVALKSGRRMLLAEPAGHVKPPKFEAELADAVAAGFRVVERPHLRRSHAALLQKS